MAMCAASLLASLPGGAQSPLRQPVPSPRGSLASGGPPAGAAGSNGYGYTFRVRQLAVDERGRRQAEPPFVARATSIGSTVRVDLLPGTEGNTVGDWFLSQDDAQIVLLVSESARTYREVSLAELRERTAAERGLHVTVERLQQERSPARPCGWSAGWPARCVRVTRRYTARSRYWLMRDAMAVVETTDYVLAPALRGMATPFGIFLSSRADLLVRRDSLFARQERELLESLRGEGAIVRVMVTQETRSSRGVSRVVRVVEVIEAGPAAVDARRLEVPSDYRLSLR
jgi:hypothetical protein